jgi:hypothetical protein
MGDLLVMLDRHFAVVRSRSRWALWSRWKFATSLGRFFSLEERIVRHVKIT